MSHLIHLWVYRTPLLGAIWRSPGLLLTRQGPENLYGRAAHLNPAGFVFDLLHEAGKVEETTLMGKEQKKKQKVMDERLDRGDEGNEEVVQEDCR